MNKSTIRCQDQSNRLIVTYPWKRSTVINIHERRRWASIENVSRIKCSHYWVMQDISHVHLVIRIYCVRSISLLFSVGFFRLISHSESAARLLFTLMIYFRSTFTLGWRILRIACPSKQSIYTIRVLLICFLHAYVDLASGRQLRETLSIMLPKRISINTNLALIMNEWWKNGVERERPHKKGTNSNHNCANFLKLTKVSHTITETAAVERLAF